MNRDQTEQKYQDEVTRGRNARAAYEAFIKDFLEDRKIALFNNFAESNPLDPKGIEVMLETRRMLSAVKLLEQEILTIIQTGDMASKSLAEIEKRNRSKKE